MNLQHTLLVPPGKALAKRLLASSRSRRRTPQEAKMLRELRKMWQEIHKSYVHQNAPPLGKVAYPQAFGWKRPLATHPRCT